MTSHTLKLLATRRHRLLPVLCAAALTSAAAPPASCVFVAGARSFDLAELGGGGGGGGAPPLRHVSHEPESALSFSACGDLPPPAACDAEAPRSAALLETAGACYGLGAAATRAVAATASGVALSFSGGDDGRSIVVAVECADVPRPQVVSWSVSKSPGSYNALVRSRAGCALECARDVAGAVCGGEHRGLCSAESAGGPVSCVCAGGHAGAACDTQARATFWGDVPALPVFLALFLLCLLCLLYKAASGYGAGWALRALASETGTAASLAARALLAVLLVCVFSFSDNSFGTPQLPAFAHQDARLPCPRSAAATDIEIGSARWTRPPAGSDSSSELPFPRLLFGGRSTPLELPHKGVRHCLRNRRIAFVGDSVTRYQYLNLAHFIAHGHWRSGLPALEDETQWDSWAGFFNGSSARLTTETSQESCDCFRPGTPLLALENRVFTDRDLNLSIAFFQLFEGVPSRGIDPERISLSECRPGAGCRQAGCQPGFCSNPTWSALGAVPLAERAALFRPDTLIFNSGLWPDSTFATPARILELEAVTELLRGVGVRDLIWKTTTAIGFNGPNPALDEDLILMPALRALTPAWRKFDAYAITAPLAASVEDGVPITEVYWDSRAHFQPPYYRGLNEALLLDLMRGCDLCES